MTTLPRDSRSVPIYAFKPVRSYHIVTEPNTTFVLQLTNQTSVVRIVLDADPRATLFFHIGWIGFGTPPGSGVSQDLSVGEYPIIMGQNPEVFKLPYRVDVPDLNPSNAFNAISVMSDHPTLSYNVYISEMM